MKLLLFYVSPHKWLILAALMLCAASQLLLMLDPHFLGIIIDRFAIHPHYKGYYNDKHEFIAQSPRSTAEFFKGVLFYLLLIVGVTIVSRIAKVVQEYYVNVITQRTGSKIFLDGLKHVMQMPYQDIENQRSGETLSILEKIKTDIEKFIAAVIGIFFSIFIALCFITVYSINIHWMIMPLYLAGIISIVLISKVISVKMKATHREITDRISAFAGITTESLRNMELLKMLGITGQQISTLNTNTEDILYLELKKIRKIRALSFIQGIFINFFRQLLLLIFIWLIFRDELTAGKLITLSLFSFMIFNPLYDIGSTVLLYREAQVSLQNLGSILKRSPQKKIGEAVPMPGIEQMEFVDVSFKYPGSAHYALNNISFCVRKGQSVAFAGPSGAGKTTLVKLLIGLYPITEGAIFYNQVNAKDIDLDILLNQNGFVPQNTQLFAGTIRENMLLAKPTATNEEIEEALEKAACQGLLARAAEGIETVIGEGGIKISGGEKQRLSIARALLRKPQVLIFDEATSALDSITEDAVSQTIQSLSFNKQHIILLIAHRLSTIMHADTIYVLEKGSIAESGTHHALLAQKGLYYAMWRQQIGERREA